MVPLSHSPPIPTDSSVHTMNIVRGWTLFFWALLPAACHSAKPSPSPDVSLLGCLMCLLEARAERSSCNNPCIIIYSQMVTQFYLFLCGDTLHIKIVKSSSGQGEGAWLCGGALANPPAPCRGFSLAAQPVSEVMCLCS